MKNIKHIILRCISILLLCILSDFAFATNYSWVGDTSTVWATSANWSPSSGVPSTNDTVTITSTGTYQPVLDQNRTIKKFTMTSGTLDLNTFNLTINGTSSFTAGTISNGKIYPTGVQATYSGTTFNCEVNSVAGKVFLNGSTFNYRCYFEDTISTATHYGNGGNTFNAPAVFKKNSVFHWGISNSSGNTFNDSVIFLNIRGNNLVATDQGTTNFNGHISIGSNAGGDIAFAGTATLASGKTISIDGTIGFTSGDLRLNNFTQSGSTSQSFTMTGSATLSFYNDTWNGAVSFIAPHVLLKMTTFNSTASFEQTHATIGSNSDGGNTFNGAATLNSSGALLRMGTTYDDTFNSNLTVVGAVNIGTTTTTIIKGNLTAAGSSYQFNNGAVSGTLKFAGSNAQHISSGGTGIIGFNKMKIDKTGGSVTLDSTITVDDTLTFVSGNIISTSTHLLSMLAGSTVTGANNNSFVSGPVKKTGNTAFVFPTGRGSDYRAIEMSAPGSISYAFTGEYFDSEQGQGDNMDTTIDYISQCNYWSLSRNTGSTNVTVKLYYDSTSCGILDSADLRVANWNGTKWKDLGNGGITGNRYAGKIANSATVATYGYFALSYETTALPYVDAGNDTLVDEGTYTLEGSSNVNVFWTPPAYLSCTDCLNPDASLTHTTLYYLHAYDYKGRIAIDSVLILVKPEQTSSAGQMFPPGVEWRAEDYAEINPFTQTEQEEEDSGDEWWYGHINSFEGPPANNIPNGYLCYGYATFKETGYTEPLPGCFDAAALPASIFTCSEFEAYGSHKGLQQAVVALKPFDGKGFSFFTVLNYGWINQVIQNDDGDYIAVGSGRATRDYFSSPQWDEIAYNPIVGQSPTYFECDGVPLEPQIWDLEHGYIAKIRADGTKEWEYLFGMTDFDSQNIYNTFINSGSFFTGIVKTATGYRVVGRSYKVSANNDFPCYFDIDNDGKLLSSTSKDFLPLPPTSPFASPGPSEARAIISFDYQGTQMNVVTGDIWGNGIGRAYTFIMEFDENDPPTVANGYAYNWLNDDASTNFATFNLGVLSGLNTHNNYVTVNYENGDPYIFLPVINAMTVGNGYSGLNSGIGRLYKIDPDPSNSGSVINGAPFAEFNQVLAYDLRINAVPLSDGGFGVVSTKKHYPPIACYDKDLQIPWSCDGGLNYEYPQDYWNTDAYVAKVDINGDIVWQTTFDSDSKNPEFYPHNYKKQECLYTITEGDDGGFVIAGNTGRNFDDLYLAKLYNDCESDFIFNNAASSSFIRPNVSGTFEHELPFTSTTWDSDKTVFGSVRVKKGQTLTIKDGATISFMDSRQVTDKSALINSSVINECFNNNILTNIVVEEGDGTLNGGKLIIEDGATLTSYSSPCAYHTMWDGIQVWGDPANSDQSNDYQGYVYFRENSIIENARYGILLGKALRDPHGDITAVDPLDNMATAKGGGVLTMKSGAAFHNCLYGVWFNPYISGNNNLSLMEEGIFECNSYTNDRSYVADAEAEDFRRVGTRNFVTLREVKRVKFRENVFSTQLQNPDFIPDEDLWGTGIKSMNSSYLVTNDNHFNYLTNGIDAQAVTIPTTYYSRVEGNTFTGNIKGITCEGCAWQNIFSNEFEQIPSIKNSYGIWMNNSQGYKIHDNNFKGDSKQFNWGVAATNSGQFYSRIQNSTFTDLTIGSQSEADNPRLRISCNDFTNHDYSIAVLLDDNSNGSFPDQGSGCQLGDRQAGNAFNDASCTNGSECHIFSEIAFTYYGNLTPSALLPAYYSSLVIVQPCNVSNDDCPAARIAFNDSIALAYRGDMEREVDSIEQLEMAYELIDYYAENDTMNSDTSITGILHYLSDNSSLKQLTAIYLSRTEFDSAEAVLSRVNLNSAEDSAFYDLYNLLIALADDDKTIFDIDAEQVEILRSLQGTKTTSAFHADVIFEMVKGEKHEHELLEIEETEERFAQQNAKENLVINSFSIEPNPARQSFYIKTRKVDEKQYINIYSTTGILVGKYNLNPLENQLEVSCVNLEPGVYFVKLSGASGDVSETNRITVIK